MEQRSADGTVSCPLCLQEVPLSDINEHIDSGCRGPKRARLASSVEDSTSTQASSARPAATGNLRSFLGVPSGGSRGTDVTPAPAAGTVNGGKGIPAEARQSPKKGEDSSSAKGSASFERRPLAERQRPTDLSYLLGQEAFGPDSPMRVLLEQDRLPSIVLWGPPGCGKTTVASIVEKRTASLFRKLSAVSAGVKDVRDVVEAAQGAWRLQKRRTILFLDECHRFNKAQQDVLLPHIESGIIVFLGATTENPSFSMNTALLSRCRVVCMKKLDNSLVEVLLRRAIEGQGLRARVTDEAISFLAKAADGDARAALNALELACNVVSCVPHAPAAAASSQHDVGRMPECSNATQPVVSAEAVANALQRAHVRYDRAGDQHYDCISAFIKSIRGSDPDAAVYWLARMLEGGEDPRFISRRLICAAAEDVGLAEPRALEQAVAAHQAVSFIGMPEASLPLAQVTVFLARAPKSAATYKAYKRAVEMVRAEPNAPPPLSVCNAPTGLMRQLGYGDGYVYPPDCGYPRRPQPYLPDAIAGRALFDPKDRETHRDDVRADLATPGA
eukprot:TRINITY_DN73599_c0_g1_i1.p1 TRINITY_DN73599_c0_g1~~TRINITY_DN73599_c0_g1_i1.p1  ORF type:complete len:559 (+),score=59.80 TRINITY_DN73599_c0_g1_i1:93-1769(+)